VVALTVAWGALGEQPGMPQLLGAAGIMTGLLLVRV
jgi:drug/metabolite transporter (DMT)-like permease